jgi:hypothetical protein
MKIKVLFRRYAVVCYGLVDFEIYQMSHRAKAALRSLAIEWT